MPPFHDEVLLQRFRLCRADLVAAMTASARPPNAKTLRELADLQLVIMATEGAISDKSDAHFLSQYESQAAA